MLNEAWAIVEHRGTLGLRQLESDWKRLHEATPGRARYHAYEAHAAYVNHLCASPDRFRYLAVSDGQQVRAIWPLEARIENALRFPIPVWGLPLHPHWSVGDVVCPDDELRRDLVPFVVRHLRAAPEGRQLLVLGPSPANSGIWGGLRALHGEDGCLHASTPSCYFDCTKSYDVLMARLTGHFRRNLRSHSKRLLSFPDARFVSVSDKEGLARALNDFMEVEASGWKGEQGTRSAIRLHAPLTAFYRDLAASMTRKGDGCEINSLYVDGRCIASQFCVYTGEDYTMLKIGYDQEYARLGPGQLLLQHTLRRCCEDAQIARLDLVSDATWSSDWKTELAPMNQAHVALGRCSNCLTIPLLRVRFDHGRRVAAWVRRTARPRTSGLASRFCALPRRPNPPRRLQPPADEGN